MSEESTTLDREFTSNGGVPPWRHFAYALLMALYVAFPGFAWLDGIPPVLAGNLLLVSIAVWAAGMIALYVWDRKTGGPFASAGGGILFLTAFFVPALLVGLQADLQEGESANVPHLALVLLAFAMGIGASKLWERHFLYQPGFGAKAGEAPDTAGNTATLEEARAALAQSNAAKMKLASAGHYSPARNAAFGLLIALYVAIPILHPELVLPAFLLFAAGAYAIYRWDLKAFGMFINGWRKGATRPFTAISAVGLVSMYIGQHYLAKSGTPIWLCYALIVFGFAYGYLMNSIWGRIFRREMGAEN